MPRSASQLPVPTRRRLLRCSADILLAVAGAVLPLRGFARTRAALDARSSREALDSLLDGRRPEKSAQIRIVASELAENGAAVPITVESDLPGIESVSFLAPENPRPLALNLRAGTRFALPVTFRVKLAKSQEVTVLVRAGGRDYSTSQLIRVVVGGCIGT